MIAKEYVGASAKRY